MKRMSFKKKTGMIRGEAIERWKKIRDRENVKIRSNEGKQGAISG